jgi:hypothetical protein
MTHILPPHSELNLSHSSLQTALQIDSNQQQQQQPPPATTSGNGRKRKKATENGEESGPAEPRRLRRSHEACARCRSKKIKASPAGRHRPQISVLANDLFSATQSIQDVLLVQMLEHYANKKTDTGKHSLLVAIQNV